MAKPGLDGHDRGAKVVARALRDAGHEVIYTGLRRTPEEIIRIVEDEDASILGLSSLSGAHGFLFPRVCELLKENGLDDIVITGDYMAGINKIGLGCLYGLTKDWRTDAYFSAHHLGRK